MPIDPQEFTSARIEQMLRCGTCGYSLYTLPMVGRCPECGSRYNAVSRRQHGILQPQFNVFPWGDVFIAGISGGVAAALLTTLMTQGTFSVWLLVYAVAFVGMAAIAGPMAWRNVCRYFHVRKITREDDELDV